jgi:cell division cycle 20-like protein 1 (cofactor of APC complex)
MFSKDNGARNFNCLRQPQSIPAPSTAEFQMPAPQIPTFKQNPFQGIADFDDNTLLKRVSSHKISKLPYKVLDAPDLRDDFYLNVVDWSDSNNLGIALTQSVYIWSASNS